MDKETISEFLDKLETYIKAVVADSGQDSALEDRIRRNALRYEFEIFLEATIGEK